MAEVTEAEALTNQRPANDRTQTMLNQYQHGAKEEVEAVDLCSLDARGEIKAAQKLRSVAMVQKA